MSFLDLFGGWPGKTSAKPKTPPQNFNVELGGQTILVQRRAVRTLRVSVHPPLGELRVVAPLRMSQKAVREFLQGKLAWIQKHQSQIQSAASREPAAAAYVDGEALPFLGRSLRLQVRTQGSVSRGRLLEGDVLLLTVPAGASRAKREQAVFAWYRRALKQEALALFPRWEQALGVQASGLVIRRMTSRWGSCNTRERRICLNLELARRSPACLEYIVVHELAHLREGRHGARFKAILDRHLPAWRALRKELNAGPVLRDE